MLRHIDKFISLYRSLPTAPERVEGDKGWSILAKDPLSPVRFVHCTENTLDDQMWMTKSMFLVPLPFSTGKPSIFVRNALSGKERSICRSVSDKVQAYTDPSSMKKVTYNDPIVVVEGVKDAEAVRIVGKYPFVIAAMTSSVRYELAQLLGALTRKVVFLFDSDDAGQRGTRKSVYRCKKLGLKTDFIELPKGVKDAGELLHESRQYSKWLESVILNKVRR